MNQIKKTHDFSTLKNFWLDKKLKISSHRLAPVAGYYL